MSHDKAIAAGKEHRTPYRGGKAVALSCRNHGDCPCCLGNRLYSSIKRLESLKYADKEYKKSQ